jgi:hypothetical protein
LDRQTNTTQRVEPIAIDLEIDQHTILPAVITAPLQQPSTIYFVQDFLSITFPLNGFLQKQPTQAKGFGWKGLSPFPRSVLDKSEALGELRRFQRGFMNRASFHDRIGC